MIPLSSSRTLAHYPPNLATPLTPDPRSTANKAGCSRAVTPNKEDTPSSSNTVRLLKVNTASKGDTTRPRLNRTTSNQVVSAASALCYLPLYDVISICFLIYLFIWSAPRIHHDRFPRTQRADVAGPCTTEQAQAKAHWTAS